MKAIRFLIPLALLAGCSTGSHANSTPTTTESIGTQIADWNDTYGDSITTLSDDITAVGEAADIYSTDELASACAQMGTDISAALDDPPIPDPETNREWRAALGDFADGADACENGAALMDADLIAEATDAFTSGSEHLTAATDRLAELAS